MNIIRNSHTHTHSHTDYFIPYRLYSIIYLVFRFYFVSALPKALPIYRIPYPKNAMLTNNTYPTHTTIENVAMEVQLSKAKFQLWEMSVLDRIKSHHINSNSDDESNAVDKSKCNNNIRMKKFFAITEFGENRRNALLFVFTFCWHYIASFRVCVCECLLFLFTAVHFLYAVCSFRYIFRTKIFLFGIWPVLVFISVYMLTMCR